MHFKWSNGYSGLLFLHPYTTSPSSGFMGTMLKNNFWQQSNIHRKIDFKLLQNATNSWSIHMGPTCRPTTSIMGRKKYKTRQLFILSEAKSVFSPSRRNKEEQMPHYTCTTWSKINWVYGGYTKRTHTCLQTDPVKFKNIYLEEALGEKGDVQNILDDHEMDWIYLLRIELI